MPLTDAGTIVGHSARLHGWGGAGTANVTLLAPTDQAQLEAAVTGCRRSRCVEPRGAGAIARGLGRSYGDAAQLSGGNVIDVSGFRGFEVDDDAGTVTAQAGVRLGELVTRLVPRGWMVPVVPGTQHVTVGGAIASDIHGKNHGTAGSLGAHVQALGLLTAAGELLELEPGDPSGLFEATIGGMGLTGVMVWARIQLVKIDSPLVTVDTDRATDLDHALALLAGPGGPHRVAWLDLLGTRPGRGVVTRAALRPFDAQPPENARYDRATVRARATVPERWPAGLLRASTVGAFNEFRYRTSPRHERGRAEGLGAHMFPLDVLDAWPRLYGREGFLQYQLVVPTGQDHVLHAVVAGLGRARVPCFLAVLKDLGPSSAALMSFPLAGWTLALDVPCAAPGVYPLLDSFDELVAGVGGRVYLTKDARLAPDTVKAMYPRLASWQEIRGAVDPDGLWRSDLAVRTGLIPRDAA
jgi:decaprenylphospho-beta-D-ribofuranose 2-oxidase